MYRIDTILQHLDEWVAAENVAAVAEGTLALRECQVRVLGQVALFVAKTNLTLNATADLDAYLKCDWAVQKKFEELLKADSLFLDPHGDEVWMPKETQYEPVYVGTWVTGYVADMDAVLVSKALKAPLKNRALIIEYLAKGASPRFMSLANTYEVDLEWFL